MNNCRAFFYSGIPVLHGSLFFSFFLLHPAQAHITQTIPKNPSQLRFFFTLNTSIDDIDFVYAWQNKLLGDYNTSFFLAASALRNIIQHPHKFQHFKFSLPDQSQKRAVLPTSSLFASLNSWWGPKDIPNKEVCRGLALKHNILVWYDILFNCSIGWSKSGLHRYPEIKDWFITTGSPGLIWAHSDHGVFTKSIKIVVSRIN